MDILPIPDDLQNVWKIYDSSSYLKESENEGRWEFEEKENKIEHVPGKCFWKGQKGRLWPQYRKMIAPDASWKQDVRNRKGQEGEDQWSQ